MAIVEFERVSHAHEARKVYHGQVIDATRPLRIRLIIDSDNHHVEPNSLSSRLNIKPTVSQSQTGPSGIETPKHGKTKDNTSATQRSQTKWHSQSLTDRIGPAVQPTTAQSQHQASMFIGAGGLGGMTPYPPPFAYQLSFPNPQVQSQPPRSARRHKMKKGPKRTAKQLERLAMSGQRKNTKTAAELDEEMDLYRREGKFGPIAS
ncbi:hypothetical protein BS47DRAFT_1337076 [Hydnum rufescens UP504]|uniref:Chromatin target of PRMT1 protein C-terminal domain-containing protein n=1 Tax=Hydnum rufescens UP504 TaxID=1448309 RepID=A0A9P6B886_9AGAM|nr:hypothetical protein BS47DRAFT_1337076 [Hydnum rufescens UP504]